MLNFPTIFHFLIPSQNKRAKCAEDEQKSLQEEMKKMKENQAVQIALGSIDAFCNVVGTAAKVKKVRRILQRGGKGNMHSATCTQYDSHVGMMLPHYTLLQIRVQFVQSPTIGVFDGSHDAFCNVVGTVKYTHRRILQRGGNRQIHQKFGPNDRSQRPAVVRRPWRMVRRRWTSWRKWGKLPRR